MYNKKIESNLLLFQDIYVEQENRHAKFSQLYTHSNNSIIDFSFVFAL